MFVASLLLRRGVVSPTPNPQAGGLPLVCCPRLLIQYSHSYPPDLKAVSSIRNLWTRNAVVTRGPHNIDCTTLYNTSATTAVRATGEERNVKHCDR
jgi:hypothetical protein